MTRTFTALGGWTFVLRNVTALGPLQHAGPRHYYEVHLVGGRVVQVGDIGVSNRQIETDRAAFLELLKLYGD